MLGQKTIAGKKFTLHKIENYIATVQLEGEKKRPRKVFELQDGYAFKFKGTNWMLGYDFNQTLDDNGCAVAIVKDSTLIPVFVYGTLRRGGWNHYRIQQAAEQVVDAKTSGSIYHNGSYPYLFEGEGTVRGELVFIKPRFYKRAMQELDGMEGYSPNRRHNHYDRKVITCVTKTGEEVQAYAYFASLSHGDTAEQYIERRRLTKIKDGDYIRWADEYGMMRGRR